MGELVNRLGKKAAGQLIKSEDWNALVAAVEDGDAKLAQSVDALSRSVDERFKETLKKIDALEEKLSRQMQTLGQQLAGQIQGLAGRVATLETQVGDLRQKLDPVLNHLWRVTLETTRRHYAIGEVAEITARVTDLQGRPLGVRPWVDFVATWGQLSAASGFESLTGEGSRTISVRTNEAGIAKLRLRSDYVQGVAEETQDEIATVFTAGFANTNRSIGDVILASKTPMEARDAGAFKALSREYDRVDTRQMRAYVDTYYVRNATRIAQPSATVDLASLGWSDHDYRATVMAFVKGDSDPQTPDAARAVSSTQITFRDWIRPWIHLGYLGAEEITPLVENYRDRLRPRVTGDFVKSMDLVRREVTDIVRDRGLIGKQRDYQALHTALDTLVVAQPPPFMNTLTQSVQDAVRIQQTIENTQVTTLGLRDQEVAFSVFTNAAARTDTNVTDVSDKVGRLEQQLGDTQRGFNDINSRVAQMQTGLTDQVTRLQGSLRNLDNDVKSHATNIGALQTNFTRVDNNVRNLGDSFTGFRNKVEPAFAQGGSLEILASRVDSVAGTVDMLKGFNVIEVQNQLAEVRNVSARVDRNLEQLGAVNSELRQVKTALNIRL